jgi:hypothetical protein
MPGTTDTVKAILTPGEFVIRKEAVDMIGAPMLNMINNMPEKGGHSNIDSLIEKATMANMKGMYGGGMVQAGPKPMGTGGMVDAYAGGGMVMDQYGHGGMVNKDMMSYKHGGKVHKNLKPVPKDNPGLGKLPEAVRNKMGYMQEGGEVQDNTATNIMNLLALNEMAERAPQYSMFDADSRGGVLSEEDILGISEGNFIPAAGILSKGYAGIFGSGDVTLSKIKKLLMSDRFNRGGEGSMLRQLSKQSPTMSDFVRNVSRTGNEELADRYAKKLLKEAKDVYKKSYQEGGEVQESLMSMMYGGMANKKKKGYQDGGPIGPPLPPEMMGEAMNQQLSDSIDMRMQNPQSGELGVVRQESDAIEAAMKDNLARNARLALQKMRLDSILSEQGASMQPEALDPRMFIPQELIQGGQSLDIRDYDKSVKKYLESEYGPQNTLRGILRVMPYLPK